MVNWLKVAAGLPFVIANDWKLRNKRYWNFPKDEKLKTFEKVTRIRRKATNTYHKYKSMKGRGPYRNVPWVKLVSKKAIRKLNHKHKFKNYKLT